MIVRILEDGQYELDDQAAAELIEIDARLTAALESNNVANFDAALAEIVAHIHTSSTKLDDQLRPSDLALPAAGSTLVEVKDLLDSEHPTKD